MKSTLLFFSFLTSTASGAALGTLKSRQLGTNSDGMGLEAIKPAVVLDAQPRVRPSAKRQVFRYGPYNLPALKEGSVAAPGGHSHGGSRGSAQGGMGMGMSTPPSGGSFGLGKPMDPNGFSVMKTISEGLPKDVTVLAGQAAVVFANGTRADISRGVYLHHVVTLNTAKKESGFVSSCPGNLSDPSQPKIREFPSFLGGAVDEFTQWFTTPDGKFNSGYHMGPNDSLTMQAEVVNYLKSNQIVYVQFDLEWVPGKVGVDSGQTFISVTGCDVANQSFGAKDNKGTVTSKEFGVYRDGHIINMRGHMHDGGVAVILYLNGNKVCTSEATYGGTGGSIKVNGKDWNTISKMSECQEPLAVKKGDYLKLEVKYDTIAHPLRDSGGMEQEEMGIMTFMFAPI